MFAFKHHLFAHKLTHLMMGVDADADDIFGVEIRLQQIRAIVDFCYLP